MLHFVSVGEGLRATVFLHGFMESLAMWEHLSFIDPAKKHVFIDLPGHGQSSIEDVESPSISFMADECLKVLKHLGTNDYAVVGHSMGGYVALEMKEKDPNCGKVVLLNSNFWEDPPQKKVDRIRVADLAMKARDLFVNESIPGLFYRHERHAQVVTDLIAEAKKMDPEAIAYASLAMSCRLAKNALLEKQAQDFLIIHGEHDPLIAVPRLREELGTIDCQVAILPNAGHMAHMEEPARLREILSDFLK